MNTSSAIASEPVAGKVVWKPAPVKAADRDSLEHGYLPEGVEDESVLDEADLLRPAEITGAPFAAPAQAALVLPPHKSSSGQEEDSEDQRDRRASDLVRFVRVPDGHGGEKWVFVLDKGETMEVDPDDAVWAFWDDPEKYHPDYFQTHYLHDGYSAVWSDSTQIVRQYYTPSPDKENTTAATTVGASVAPSLPTCSAPSFGAPSEFLGSV